MQPNACSIRKIKNDMTDNGESVPPPSPQRNERLPPEILDIIKPALQVGSLSGTSGFIIGGFAGVIRSSTPFLFALASGIQWFALGTTFWASRGIVLRAWRDDKVTPKDKITASAIAGGVGGASGGILRGPRNVLPGALMFGLFGAAGQALFNSADAKNLKQANAPERDLKDSWLNSKWSPMKVLSDQEYEDMLREKLLRVNAEIALVDEKIEALRVMEHGDAEGKSGSRDVEGGTEKSAE
ncbi:hypothetical protein D0Z07_5051 [Hyphodiscus hymeniophilus]|uniref:Uncharacterized protein n=1 Tax=Hyphodiscus hymeniophilus TaxID=353542 RepID=A0A9P7AX42_9HELO|nr:hypothetical protein D0Z07_5051 [Hyphodiscus hymeniophilus]